MACQYAIEITIYFAWSRYAKSISVVHLRYYTLPDDTAPRSARRTGYRLFAADARTVHCARIRLTACTWMKARPRVDPRAPHLTRLLALRLIFVHAMQTSTQRSVAAGCYSLLAHLANSPTRPLVRKHKRSARRYGKFTIERAFSTRKSQSVLGAPRCVASRSGRGPWSRRRIAPQK